MMTGGGISRGMRDVLIQHIDGPVQLRARDGGQKRKRALTMGAIAGGLLTRDRHKNPKFTAITEKGRAVLARCLADWLDAMLRAEFTKDEAIIEALAGARAARAAPPPVVSHDMARAEP